MSNEPKYETHPSYGLIGISHVSGGARLVGSDFVHQHYVSLRIKRAERKRDMSHEWWGEKDQIVEIAMSEAQFIELMARPNMGTGVPCTIKSVQGEGHMPEPPAPEPVVQMFDRDMQQSIQHLQKNILDTVEALSKASEEGRVGKKFLAEQLFHLKCMAQNLAPNLEFVEKSFRQHMEVGLHKFAAEAEAIVTNMAIRLGIEQMRTIAATAPKMIEASEFEGDISDRNPPGSEELPLARMKAQSWFATGARPEQVAAEIGHPEQVQQWYREWTAERALLPPLDLKPTEQKWFPPATVAAQLEMSFALGQATDEVLADHYGVDTLDITILRHKWEDEQQ